MNVYFEERGGIHMQSTLNTTLYFLLFLVNLRSLKMVALCVKSESSLLSRKQFYVLVYILFTVIIFKNKHIYVLINRKKYFHLSDIWKCVKPNVTLKFFPSFKLLARLVQAVLTYRKSSEKVAEVSPKNWPIFPACRYFVSWALNKHTRRKGSK